MIRPQSCTLESELCFSALGDVGQGSAQHLPLCLHALLAFFFTSTCVGKGIDVCNLKSYRQNQMPLFCLSDVNSTNAKWWLLSLIHCSCETEDPDTNVKMELVWKESGMGIWGLTYLPAGCTGLALSVSWEEKEQVSEVAAVLFERFGNKNVCGKCFQTVRKKRASWCLQNYMLAFFELQENDPKSFLG